MNLPHASRAQRYLLVSFRWIFIGAFVFAVTVLVGRYVTNNLLAKVYTASAMVELPARDLATPGPGTSPQPVALQPEFENTMMSPDFLLAVVKDLGLDKAWAKRIYATEEDQLPDRDALTHMQKSLKFEAKRGTNIVEITASSDVPQEAADIANGMADRYEAMSVEKESCPGHRVQILCRAEPPMEPSTPDRNFNYVVTLVTASLLSLLAASFVEMVFLFLRAGDRATN